MQKIVVIHSNHSLILVWKQLVNHAQAFELTEFNGMDNVIGYLRTHRPCLIIVEYDLLPDITTTLAEIKTIAPTWVVDDGSNEGKRNEINSTGAEFVMVTEVIFLLGSITQPES